MITPANRTPQKHAPMLSLKSSSNILAAKIPVHAPVPGTGIPTKRTNARNIPLPAFFLSFFPACLPFSRQNVKKLPMYFLSFPFVYHLLEFISSSHFLNASTVNWYGVFPPSHCISFSSVNSISIFILLSKSKLSLILCFINRHVLFGRVSVLFDIFFIIWLFTSLFIIRFRYNYDIGGELWILTSLTFRIFYFNYVMLFYCFV